MRNVAEHSGSRTCFTSGLITAGEILREDTAILGPLLPEPTRRQARNSGVLRTVRSDSGAAGAGALERSPRPLHDGDVIGITAPSAGVGPDLEPHLEFCVDSLRRLGQTPRLGRCLLSDRIFSAPAEDRALELTEMLLDDAVAAVLPPWSGELLIGTITYLGSARLGKATPT